VGKAYEALKTDSKRRYYNMTGEEEPTEQPRGPRFRHGGGLTPEEIFAQVFGGRCT
jgi:DnaJ-class molecular chaperone